MTMVTRVTKRLAPTPELGSDTWTVAGAKAHFSEVLERARGRGPQTITRNGRPAAVIVAPDEWARKTRRVGSLADFFAASPLRGAHDLVIERRMDLPREIVL
jgi:prevent-host-death family protein